MAELTTGGIRYISNTKLDAFTQLHLARKLGPALPIIQGMVDTANANKDKTLLVVLALAHVSDEDTDFIVKKCLSVISRQQPDGSFAKLQHTNGSLMFEDTPMATLLELTVAIIEENLGDFFRTALASLAAATATD